MAELEEHLNHEGIVVFPVYIHHMQMNCWLRKSNTVPGKIGRWNPLHFVG